MREKAMLYEDVTAKEHYAQVLNYVKTTGIEVGMVVNFGNPRLQY